ncbi:hypothetical protein EGT74_04980 [Chitinophaga lutea]|uniref:O-antigen ligase-related domain-containing protein n=2 Tax=Chitinophaga lutea TaxID=2488634 RepID=A0A3N4Q5U8_9BACT|nr:hypothetical protein EGT74_04980 [Chitinophaga lutea]
MRICASVAKKIGVSPLMLYPLIAAAIIFVPNVSGWPATPSVYLVFLGFSILPFFLISSVAKRIKLNVTWLDLAVGVAGIYFLGWYIWMPCSSDYLFVFLALGGVYIFSRCYKICQNNIQYIVGLSVYTVILSCIPELFRAVHATPSPYVPLRGSIGNSGLLSIALALSCPIFIDAIIRNFPRNRTKANAALLLFCPILIIVAQSGSRTATLILAFGLLLPVARMISNSAGKTLYFLFMGFAVALSACLSGLTVKQGSANGRILIWNVSMDMFRDNPVFGVGPGQYQVQYLDYQEHYFRDDAARISRAGTYADNNQLAFNEALHWTVEFGVVGLFLLAVIIYLAFKGGMSLLENGSCVSFDMLFLFFVACSFSYPLHITPLLVFFLMLLASLSNGLQPIRAGYFSAVISGKYASFFLIMIGMSGTIASINQFRLHVRWKSASMSILSNEETALKEYQDLYPFLQSRGTFLYNYGAELFEVGRYRECIEVLDKASEQFNHTDLHLYLGKAYEKLGKLDSAIFRYTKADYMIPSRFYPKYFLAMLYQANGQRDLAKEFAYKILSMSAKVPSKSIDDMKTKMRKIIANEVE